MHKNADLNKNYAENLNAVVVFFFFPGYVSHNILYQMKTGRADEHKD